MSPFFHINECFSTNDEVLSYLSNDDFVAVYTFNQTNGRGQYGNVWKTKPNQNLAYSIALKCSKTIYSDIILNYYTAIIVRDFLANLTNLDVHIKWPNDIILVKKKVCGILIEKKKVNKDVFYIIGIGINILQTDFSLFPKAGSILSVANINCDLDDFTKKFHVNLVEKLNMNLSEEEIIKLYNHHLFKKNKISVFLKNGIRQNGIIKKADKNGYLWIDLENDGLSQFFHKEIELLY